MGQDLLGMVRIGEKTVRFFSPPTKPDFAWVSLRDLITAVGYPEVFASEECRKLYTRGEMVTNDGEEVVVVIPHIVAFSIATAAETHLRKDRMSNLYSAANAEVTKVLFIGMTDEQKNKYIFNAFEFNRISLDGRGKIKNMANIFRRLVASVASLSRKTSTVEL